MDSNKYYPLKIHAQFGVLPGYYILFKPLHVPYDKVKEIYFRAGQLDWSFGMIEIIPLMGRGFVGFPVTRGAPIQGLEVRELFGRYMMRDIHGNQEMVSQALKEMMKDFPHAKNFIVIHKNDTGVTAPQDLITTIGCEY